MPIGQYIISRNEHGFTHDQAVALATAHGGTLAALTTVEENNLFLSFLSADSLLWVNEPHDGARNGPWIGLTKIGGAGPGDGWTWDTGEAYSFTAWHSTQPDHAFGDSYAFFWDYGGSIGWADQVGDPTGIGYGATDTAAIEVGAGRTQLNGTNGHDFIWGGETDNFIKGKDGNDSLSGGGGEDSILGGAGKDTIIGGVGSDQMVGGKGADHFVFLTADDTTAQHTDFNADSLSDFSHKQGDIVDLSAFGDLAPMDEYAFSGVGQVRYERSPEFQAWWVYVNLSGDTAPELAFLMPHKPLWVDFIL